MAYKVVMEVCLLLHKTVWYSCNGDKDNIMCLSLAPLPSQVAKCKMPKKHKKDVLETDSLTADGPVSPVMAATTCFAVLTAAAISCHHDHSLACSGDQLWCHSI